MAVIKLGEQIAFLRKQNKMTQEALAEALGVTNQAVSKWESAQCCPDISILPDIAELFGVSVDELMGHRRTCSVSDLLLRIRREIGAGREEGFFAALQFAYASHAAVVAELLRESEGETKVETALSEEAAPRAWGNSCIADRKFSSVRRGGSVFFSDNALCTDKGASDEVLLTLQTVSEPTCLKILFALHKLTVETDGGSAEAISSEIGIGETIVKNCLRDRLGGFVREMSCAEGETYRLEERYLPLAPLLSLLGEFGERTAR